MMRTALLFVLLLLPSCGLYTQLNDAVNRVDIATKDADKALEGVQAGLVAMGTQGEQIAAKLQEVRAALSDADKNGDGRVVGMDEWYALIVQLLTILGVGGYAASTNAKRRQNVTAIYGELDAIKDRVRVAELPPVR